MPGIAGIISKMPRKRNEKDLRLMNECMMHEPFYTSGSYVNDQLCLYAGWGHLKGSFSDCMPIMNEKRDLVLIFTGENFIDKEVTDQLKNNGHEFGGLNASYIIHMYEEEGEEFFQKLNGWFSGILVDLRKEKIVLFNDRYGIQRIYYHESKDAFFFSSEAKSLLKVCPELRKIDPKGLGEFFTYGCVLQSRTLFSNVFLLPGGSAWTFRNGNIVKRDYYFKPSDWEDQPVLEKEPFYIKLRDTFLSILPRYFHSEQQIGISLTGGLDNRMILACSDNPPSSLQCYTFGGMYRDCFDVRVARKVAEACHQEYHVLQLDGEFLTDFPMHAEKTIYVTDGCLDVCGSHEVYFNRLAREIAPIRMTGNYGSEVIRNHSTFKAFPPCEELFNPDFNNFLQEAKRTFTNIREGNMLSFAVFKEVPWQRYSRLAAAESQLMLRSPFMDNDLVRLMYQAPADVRANNEISLRLIADSNSTLLNIMTDRGVGGRYNYLFSKSAQLFHRYLVKAEWYYNVEMPHWVAKIDYTLRPLHLEKFMLGWHTFLHYRKWFSNELSNYMRRILLDKRTASRPHLNKKFMEEMVNGHLKGNRNYINEINKTLTVELIYRLLIEQK